MDDAFGHLMHIREEGYGEDDRAVAEKRGECRGIAWCLALLTNPYDPDLDAIRQEAKERYEQARNAS